MIPYYQGQLDIFCPIYSIVNGLVLIRRIRFETARSILSESIFEMSKQPDLFKKQLDHSIEYYDLVDEVLKREKKHYDLITKTPFADACALTETLAWKMLSSWLNQPKQVAIIRFERILAMPGEPKINHWTTLQAVQDNSLIMFDCSRDEGAIHKIDQEEFIIDEKKLRPGLIYVDLKSVRFMA